MPLPSTSLSLRSMATHSSTFIIYVNCKKISLGLIENLYQTISLNSVLKIKEKYMHYLYDEAMEKHAKDSWIDEKYIFNYYLYVSLL